MEPFSLMALASAAGFVFKKMTGAEGGKKKGRFSKLLPRRSKITPGHLKNKERGLISMRLRNFRIIFL